MRCEVAERQVSARLDGELNPAAEADLEEHLGSCPSCRAFRARASRLRELVRVSPAAPVPDLVPAIMAEVRRGAAGEPGRLRREPPVRLPAWGRYAAAFAAGALGAVLVLAGLPGFRPGLSPALATEIPQEVAAASTQVTAYRATFDVLERHFHPRVPERRFVARVNFRSPERFRATVTDATTYPGENWPLNDTVVTVDRDRWLARGPAACPREALPTCSTGGEDVRRVTGREPFDGDALLPTDIVLPVRTLAGTDRVRVVGQDTLLNRDVVVIELAYSDAVPLFTYLHAAGSWRPLFPLDRVLISLDAESWFPLAYEVRAASSTDRGDWAQANALPIERTGALLLRVTARSFRPAVSRAPSLPALPGAHDEGFRDVPMSQLAADTGNTVALPRDLAGLRPYRAGTFTAGGRPEDEVLLSFTRGLTWLKVRQTASWDEPHLFGDVTALAIPLETANGGVAYYEPATATLGRRLSIHSPGMDLYLETNLSREMLLRVAASIPVRGRPIPESWLTVSWQGGTLRLQVPLDEAQAEVPDLHLPSSLPQSYELWTIHLVRQGQATGAAVYFRRPGAELDGVGIRYYQAPGDGLAPPLDPDVARVRLGDAVARYSPTRGELEWVIDGTYRSITAPTLDLATLLRVARSVESS
jgi:Putative zinc-finger